jgi:hypothetical protein
LEEQLLLEPNFRDIVFKTFVDYARINQKFGRWIEYLIQQPNLDEETIEFITCLDLWRSYLMLGMDSEKKTRRIPDLKMDQHPILFGRIFGMKLLMMKKKSSKSLWETKFKKRLEAQPQFATELLYEPCVQCLVSRNPALMKIIQEYAHLVNDIKFWYHISQVSIHRVFQVACLIDEGQYVKASQILEKITFGHIRHGYREFIELFTSFFKLQIALKLGEPTEKLQSEFQHYRSKIDYPIFTDEYFEHYFQRSSAKGKNE